MSRSLIFSTLIIIVVVNNVHSLTNLKEKFKWHEIEFEWPSEDVKNTWNASKKYIPENNLPLGVERWQNKLFITIPRWKPGVAATLNYVDLNESSESPKFKPYPSWEDNDINLPSNGSEAGIKGDSNVVSVFRTRADACDRLWVQDSGVSDIWGNFDVIAPNALVIFDLKSDKLIRRFVIPSDLLKENSFVANVVVDVDPNDCENAFAYLSDLGAYAIIVYSFKENKAWRVKHHYFAFDPLAGNYTVGGVNFQWTDGIFGIALDRLKENGVRNVYFHAFSSTKEFMVSNKVLQNESYSTSEASFNEFQLLGERGMNSQSSVEMFDEKTGVIFYTMVNRDAIGCWNTKKPYTADNQGMVDSDQTALEFPNDLKVDNEGNLWVISDRMPRWLLNNEILEDDNYRILTGKTELLIKGTPCEN
uniref:CSON011032 protein n=1 Tax=Culicoides sonorensis TaxID=179676 RepID=A0A336N022_CULSO